MDEAESFGILVVVGGLRQQRDHGGVQHVVRNVLNAMSTTKIFIKRQWILSFDVFADQGPPGSQDPSGARHFEIIHINNKQQMPCGMQVTGPPVSDRAEACFAQAFITMALPMSPRVRVPIKSKLQRDNGLAKFAAPVCGPLVWWQRHPRRHVTVEFSLDVNLLGIRGLARETRHNP